MDQRILELMDRMNHLHEGEDAVDLLAARGEKAVFPLQKYLLEGKPSHIYQARQRAVQALAKLEAKKALLEYLSMPKEIDDPIIRFGEEAVENTAARALAGWRTSDVFEGLLKIAHTRNLPGVIETLGLFRRAETIPLFIAALGDDLCNSAAENALRLIGERAKSALIEILSSGTHEPYDESPSKRIQRRSAVLILSQLKLSLREWRKMRALLNDRDLEISVTLSGIALEVADDDDKRVALNNLIQAIPQVDWHIQAEIERFMVRHFDFAEGTVEKEIRERREKIKEKTGEDRTLQMLLYIQKKVEGNKSTQSEKATLGEQDETIRLSLQR